MRWSTFVKRQPAQPVSDDPADLFEHGVAPRHRLTSPLHALQRGQLVPQSFGGILVRLPRRLSKLPAEDAHRWVRGENPMPSPVVPGLVAAGSGENRWERAYPGRGLGLPKPLPRRAVLRQPLTLRDLRQRVARIEAESVRLGEFHNFHLTAQELSEVLADPEAERMARGFPAGPLPDGCFGQYGKIRVFLIPGVLEMFRQSTQRLGEQMAAALNQIARHAMLARHHKQP